MLGATDIDDIPLASRGQRHCGRIAVVYEEEVFVFSETACAWPRSELIRSTSFRGLKGFVM